MIRSQTGTSGEPHHKEPTESQYSPGGRPWGPETWTPPAYWNQPAMREVVNAQIDSLKEHIEASIRIVKAELEGQVEVLRRDIKDLQSKKKQKEEKGWSVKMILLQACLALVTTGIGILIGVFVVK